MKQSRDVVKKTYLNQFEYSHIHHELSFYILIWEKKSTMKCL